MPMDPLIERRFRGPHETGNGGYSAGIAASYIEGPAEVTLRRPPPLDRRLEVKTDGDRVLFLDEGELIMEASPTALDLDVPEPPTFDQARTLEPDPAMYEGHVFPECFVCGPAREPGDGLRIIPGPVPGSSVVAAAWEPDASLRYLDGDVGRPFLWAALDCPSGWASADASQAAGNAIVLGRIAAEVRRNATVGEKLVVTAWPLGVDGRKRYAGSAIHADGELIACARTTWITLS